MLEWFVRWWRSLIWGREMEIAVIGVQASGKVSRTTPKSEGKGGPALTSFLTDPTDDWLATCVTDFPRSRLGRRALL